VTRRFHRTVGALAAVAALGLLTAPPAWAHGDTSEPSATNDVSRILASPNR
jgi:hypothetical protein